MPKGPGLLLTFFYYFSTATLLADVVLAQQLHLGMNNQATLQLSLLVGTMTGLLGLYMNRSSTLNFKIGNKRRFQTQLSTALTELGFEDQVDEDDFTIYSQSGWQRWFSGKILVKIERQSVTIVGRASNIRQLAPLVRQK
ncbi:MAG: hypothetical protein F6J87_28655 [Spirulina sp. SIO3F2]|nr:hypothetical protein [Spirulina sp. SIO3F2]